MTEKKTSFELNKENSRYLRGTLGDSLAADTTHFSNDEVALLKFHGSYQQDDRDSRQARAKDKLEPAYSMMVRSKIPGGRLSAEQYLVHDALCDAYGNHTMRLTDRQGIQFHGVLKKNMRQVVRGICKKLGTTSGACGDIVRNVMACPAPLADRSRLEIYQWAVKLSDQFLSRSGAYAEVWLDGEKADVDNRPAEEAEPIYGKAYLPRKFKIAVACPDDNCIDVYTHDLGVVPEVDANGNLTGFNLLVGGGLGMTHGIEKTYPRLASPLCFVKPQDLLEAAKAIVLVQRDFGNRQDRKRARLKYLLDERGLDWFRGEMEKRFGKKTEAPRKLQLGPIQNHLGWQRSASGKWCYGLFVENGRVKDEGSFRLKSVLRKIAEKYSPVIYITAHQDILMDGFEESQKSELEALLVAHGIKLSEKISNVRRDAMACPALPTCGLAIAEAERALPSILDALEKEIRALGLEDQKFLIRATGCPNGCARPYNAEIAFVGRNPGAYNILVGGRWQGDHLNKTLAEKIPQADLTKTLRPLLVSYKETRHSGETFGDFCLRVGLDFLKGLLPVSAPSSQPAAE